MSNGVESRRFASDFMPQDAQSHRILQERSEQISRQESEKTERKEGVTYVRFRLGDNESYGIHYQIIKEIMGVVTLTKLPGVPDFISGIINRRGALLAVLDLKKFFNFPVVTYEKNAYILIVKSNGGITMGILADGIDGSDNYDPSTLDPPLPSLDAIKPEYLIGLHRGVTSIINFETIVNDPKLLQMMKQEPYRF